MICPNYNSFEHLADFYASYTFDPSEVTNYSRRLVLFLEVFDLIHRKFHIDPSFSSSRQGK